MKQEAPTLDFLLEEWDKDSKIDPVDLGKELLRVPILHAKYLRYLTLHNIAVRRANLEMQRLRKIKWAYYSGKMDKSELNQYGWEPFPFVLKSDITVYLDGDADISKQQKKKSYHEEASAVCTSVMKELQNRTWQLREYMTHQRFEHGS